MPEASSSVSLRGKTAVWLTKWAWPFGGGEAAFYECMRFAVDLGMTVYWCSFGDAQNRPHQHFTVRTVEFSGRAAYLVQIPNGEDEATLTAWLRLLRPHIVQHQGNLKRYCLRICRRLRIPFVSAFHFWHECIDLNPTSENSDILQHSHRKHDHFDEIVSDSAVVYFASEFMAGAVEHVTGYATHHLVYPLPTEEHCLASVRSPRYVTQVNTHEKKGGRILLHLLNTIKDLPFLAISTEPQSEVLDERIRDAIKQRRDGSMFMHHTNDMPAVYAKTKILLVPSLVDETFCRVAVEGLANGIPILTTGKGNLANIVTSDCGLVLDAADLRAWTSSLKRLARQPSLYNAKSRGALERYHSHFEQDIARQQFAKVLSCALCQPERVMIFTPWCDQGLGIQSREYARLLQESNREVFIFAFASYWEKHTALQRNQRDTAEWKGIEVYYSPHERETVTDQEIVLFIERHHITHCLLPETCWARVFEVAQLLRSKHVRCLAVPNIEIVRRDELAKHCYFDGILCNNHLCKEIFDRHGYAAKTRYLGFALPARFDAQQQIPLQRQGLSILFLGGFNAFHRKQMRMVLDAFVKALRRRSRTATSLHLVACAQFVSAEQEQYLAPYRKVPDIELVTEHLSHSQVYALYDRADITVQVSKHEGLGLGFFESLSSGTPVITIDSAPHNEIIQDGVNGLVLACRRYANEENPQSPVESADVDAVALTDTFAQLTAEQVQRLTQSARAHYVQNFARDAFQQRLLACLQ